MSSEKQIRDLLLAEVREARILPADLMQRYVQAYVKLMQHLQDAVTAFKHEQEEAKRRAEEKWKQDQLIYNRAWEAREARREAMRVLPDQVRGPKLPGVWPHRMPPPDDD